MDFDKLSLGDRIAGGCGIVLFIGLLFLPWHSVDLGPFGSETWNALSGTNELWGFLALLLTVLVVAAIIITRLTSVELPELPISWNQAIFYDTIAVLVVLLLKLLLETDFLGWGAWVNLILAAGMTYGGFLIFQDKESAAAAGGGGSDPQPF